MRRVWWSLGQWTRLLMLAGSAPIRALSWLTGWSCCALASDLLKLHFVGIVVMAAREHDAWSVPMICLWGFYDLWSDPKRIKVVAAWHESLAEGGTPAVIREWLSFTQQLAFIGTLVVIATAVWPNGLGEVVWGELACCYAGVVYGGGPRTPATSRVKDWVASRATAARPALGGA